MNVYLKDSVFTTRIDKSENWAAANPVLYKGERGIDSTEGKEKVGDGVTAWNDLPWFGGGGAERCSLGLEKKGGSGGGS